MICYFASKHWMSASLTALWSADVLLLLAVRHCGRRAASGRFMSLSVSSHLHCLGIIEVGEAEWGESQALYTWSPKSWVVCSIVLAFHRFMVHCEYALIPMPGLCIGAFGKHFIYGDDETSYKTTGHADSAALKCSLSALKRTIFTVDLAWNNKQPLDLYLVSEVIICLCTLMWGFPLYVCTCVLYVSYIPLYNAKIKFS